MQSNLDRTRNLCQTHQSIETASTEELISAARWGILDISKIDAYQEYRNK